MDKYNSMMKRYLMKRRAFDCVGAFLCSIGLHKYRIRKNGASSERVCMRPGCNHREKLYRLKEGKVTIWNEKKIPVRGRAFKKAEK